MNTGKTEQPVTFFTRENLVHELDENLKRVRRKIILREVDPSSDTNKIKRSSFRA